MCATLGIIEHNCQLIEILSLTNAAMAPEPLNEFGEFGYERNGIYLRRLIWRPQRGIDVAGQGKDGDNGD